MKNTLLLLTVLSCYLISCSDDAPGIKDISGDYDVNIHYLEQSSGPDIDSFYSGNFTILEQNDTLIIRYPKIDGQPRVYTLDHKTIYEDSTVFYVNHLMPSLRLAIYHATQKIYFKEIYDLNSVGDNYMYYYEIQSR